MVYLEQGIGPSSLAIIAGTIVVIKSRLIHSNTAVKYSIKAVRL